MENTSKPILVLSFDPHRRRHLRQVLESQGLTVEEGEPTEATYYRVKETLPLAILIDLSRRPSHGRELAEALGITKATRPVPAICVGIAEADWEKTRKKAPRDLLLSTEEEAELLGDFGTLLKRAQENQPSRLQH